MTDLWLNSEDPVVGVRSALEGIAAVYAEHGQVLRGFSDVEAAYNGAVQGFVDATARQNS